MNRDRYPMYYKGHPKLYFKRMPIFWWTKKWAHARFILRELTSVAVAFYAIIMILLIRSVKNGPDAYAAMVDWLKSPTAMALHLLAFLLVVYHSLTWFNLAPKAMVIQVGTKHIPGKLIAGLNYLVWIGISAVLIWILIM